MFGSGASGLVDPRTSGRSRAYASAVDIALVAGSGVPKHVQVREYVRGLLREAAPGTAAPSERELVHQFHIARMTVRQAMDALVAEGLLERIPGRGTFVARPRREVGRLRSYTEEMAARGLLAESQTLVARREQAGPGVARALGVTPGDAVIRWKRLRRADGIPMCVEDAYLNEVLLPGFLQTGMPTSLYDALAARGLRPTWAEDSVSADVASAQEAEHLEIEAGSSVLRQTRRALNEEKIVEVSRSVYRADRFSWRVQLGQGH
jgi:GntR family transcriptional regulator